MDVDALIVNLHDPEWSHHQVEGAVRNVASVGIWVQSSPVMPIIPISIEEENLSSRPPLDVLTHHVGQKSPAKRFQGSSQ